MFSAVNGTLFIVHLWRIFSGLLLYMRSVEAKINNAGVLTGEVILPGDKSISHRAAMLAALAEGDTRIDNFAASEDCESTLKVLADLGVKIGRDGNSVVVHGVGKSGFLKPTRPLDCGNSGTTMRLMAGALAAQNFESTLIGDKSLSLRPMKRVIEPLSQMGVHIDSVDGHAPLTIQGQRPLKVTEYRLPIASAQIKSCVLLAGLSAAGKTTVIESVASRDHSERMLTWLGVDVEILDEADGRHISINGDSKLTARNIIVPADISSAAFFMVAAACLPGSDLTMPNVGVNPSRRAVVEVLRHLGAQITLADEREQNGEPVAIISVAGGLKPRLSSEPLRGKIIANLIDEIPILAVFGTQIDGGIEIRDAGELRVKESDRISSVVDNLRRMGATVEEFDDGLRVEKSGLIGAELDSFGDHRITMAFGIAGLFADGETTIKNANCADVSFPGFFEMLRSVVR